MSRCLPDDELLDAAFRESNAGYSEDRVIADPDLNSAFVAACRQRGLTEAPVDLNLRLLNLRKRGGFAGCTSRTSIPRQDEFAFAAEMAVRCLERKHRTTLDRILCDPGLAAEFDEVAQRIAPGFTPLQYRWAALRLRKKSSLKPELLARVVPAQVVGPVVAAEVDISLVPNEQGLYIFTTRESVLYIGEAKNLRARLRKHLEHSDNKFLARHIWECGMADLLVEYHVLPPDTRTDVRKAMELELIRSRRADFNVQR
jgi:site-specific DNA-methyltransferase (adenine-specific)